MVEVMDSRQWIRMESLQIGDMVRVEGGSFSKVYSFGHYDPDMSATYLQIHVQDKTRKGSPPLEISEHHLIYTIVPGRNTTVTIPASMLKVGDQLVLSSGAATTVSKIIKNVSRKGAYAPFTMSGNIVVSDILASNYISMIDTTTLPRITKMMHWMAHAFQTPHRLVCSWDLTQRQFCENETYTNGLSNWIYASYHLVRWMTETSHSHPRLFFFLACGAMVVVLSLLARSLSFVKAMVGPLTSTKKVLIV